jgi:hypothetical protein
MQMNTTYHRVLWRQVWGLAALLAAIVFSWMAYSFYQPVILTNLGFIELAQSLGIIQGFLGAAIEPLAGIMSDRSMHKIGSRLPGIAVGITLAGLLFVAQIPWCLGRLPAHQAGLSTGLYFGGMGAANAFLTLIIQLWSWGR